VAGMPPLVEQQLRALLGQMARVVGDGYQVSFVARHRSKHNADILLGDKKLNELLSERTKDVLQIERSEQ
jgi:hypothetical protein